MAAVTTLPPVEQDDIFSLSSLFPQSKSAPRANTATSSSSSGDNTNDIPIYQLAFAGAIATAFGDAAVHPLDCIKTLQQSDEYLGTTIPQAIQILWTQYDGFEGFYRGLGTYLLTDAVAGALKFGTYETLQKKTENMMKPPPLAVLAGIAFVASSLILVPGELVKQQLQMGHYTSLSEAAEGIFTEKGLLGFYTGYSAVCWRDVPYTMMELSIYDWLKRLPIPQLNTRTTTGPNEESKVDLSTTTATMDEAWAGAITGGIAGFCTTPLDTIKTKLMVDGDYYSGYFSCLSDTVQEHGIVSLFSGSLARVAWLLPFSAIYLPLFDALKRMLLEWNQQQEREIGVVERYSRAVNEQQ